MSKGEQSILGALEQQARTLQQEIRDRGEMTILDEQGDDFLSQKYLARDDIDRDAVRETQGAFLDKCFFDDLAVPRIWQRRDYLSNQYRDGSAGLNVANDVIHILPHNTHIPILQDLYKLSTGLGLDVYTVAVDASAWPDGFGISDPVPDYVAQKNLHGVPLPDDEYAWAQSNNMVGDASIMEYAFQQDLAVVTADADLGRIQQERGRYSDIPVLPIDAAAICYRELVEEH